MQYWCIVHCRFSSYRPRLHVKAITQLSKHEHYNVMSCSCSVCINFRLNKCSAVAEMGNRVATIDMGRKLGAVPLMGGS